MHTAVFRFSFDEDVNLIEAEATLQLAILAAEGLLGESRVRMEFSYHLDAPRAALLVDGSTASGDAIVRIYTAFLSREFGSDRFAVRRMPSPATASVPKTGVAA